MIYTVAKLKREFGLPFSTAEAIIHEQTNTARRRYRFWYVLNGVMLAAAVACKFAPRDSLHDHMDDFLLPLACLCLGVGEILTQRKAPPLIRAAALATAAAC